MSVRPGPALLALVLATGCGGDPYRFDAPRAAAGMDLAPYARQEECVALDRDQSFDFYFVSTAPIAFSIYYHEGNALIVPDVREHATVETGQFRANHKDVYCVRWEAGAEPSLLEYRLQRRPPR